MICIIGDESRIGFPIAAFFFAGFCPCLPQQAGGQYARRLRLFRPGGLNTPALFFAGFCPTGNAPGGSGYFALTGSIRLRGAPHFPAGQLRRAVALLRRSAMRAPGSGYFALAGAMRLLGAPCGARFRSHQCIKFAASRYFLSDSPIFDFNSYLSITALSNFDDSSSHVRHASARIFSSPEFMSRHVAQILAS